MNEEEYKSILNKLSKEDLIKIIIDLRNRTGSWFYYLPPHENTIWPNYADRIYCSDNGYECRTTFNC